MHARLAAVDPDSAARLHPNDQQRIQRALEIIEISGMTATAFYARTPRGRSAEHWCKLALNPPARSELHARIAQRFHAMMARSEEHTSELQSLMRISYAVFCLKKKKKTRYTQQLQH